MIRLGAWELFWIQHYDRPTLVESLNDETKRSYWEYWVAFFGLTPEWPEAEKFIGENRKKYQAFRKRHKFKK